MTINELLIFGSKKLRQKKIISAEIDAEVILANVLRKSKEYIYTHPEKKVANREIKAYKKMLRRRENFEPVAYLVCKKEFYGRDFFVNKNVLIPRPETELLIDEIIEYVNSHPPKEKNTFPIADIGTGSGCVAITLKKLFPKFQVFASDISNKAIIVAKKNSRRHKANVQFFGGDLLTPLKNIKIYIIAANLPYLNNVALRKKSLAYEPKLALDGGKAGLDIYEKLFIQLKSRQKPKLLICEIDNINLPKFKNLLKKYFKNNSVEIKKDYSGNIRVLKIYF